MTKNDIVNELNKMGYEVREENVVKNKYKTNNSIL